MIILIINRFMCFKQVLKVEKKIYGFAVDIMRPLLNIKINLHAILYLLLKNLNTNIKLLKYIFYLYYCDSKYNTISGNIILYNTVLMI